MLIFKRVSFITMLRTCLGHAATFISAHMLYGESSASCDPHLSSILLPLLVPQVHFSHIYTHTLYLDEKGSHFPNHLF